MADTFKPANIENIKSSAEKGDSISQYVLGKCYIDGDSVKQDIQKGLGMLTELAFTGHDDIHKDAAITMAVYLEDTEEYLHALTWYKMIAYEYNDENAQHRVAVFYSNGMGVSKDTAEAVKWFQKSIDNGITDKALDIARSYITSVKNLETIISDLDA